MKTLEQYFKDCAKLDIIDFAIRANTYAKKTTFYIHPQYASGETLDFIIEGNNLKEGDINGS